MNINKEILKTIKYFHFFTYYPTLTEIYTFLQAKISKNSLNKELERMGRLNVIGIYKKHTPPQYSIGKKILNNKYDISKKKLDSWRYRMYIKLLSFFPQIKLVGLSGSISMMNAGIGDDIDLFIITAKNRLFTGRFIALVLAQIIGLRRTRKARYQKFFDGKPQTAKNLVSSLSFNNETMEQYSNNVRNKVCLNLIFDESALQVPKFKQTEYVGHEVLQMKPIINRDQTYERFLEANKWVQTIFPNSDLIVSKVKSQNYFKNFKLLTLTSNFLLLTFNFIESILKNLQLTLINSHRTTELISNSQLWFHPVDFGKKIKY